MPFSPERVGSSPATVTVAATVRAELARRRVQQATVAEALSLSQTAVSRRLAGLIPFNVDELVQVARLLDMSVHDLLPEPVAS